MNVPVCHEYGPRGPAMGLSDSCGPRRAAKQALFFDPDCKRPPIYSCCLLSKCPGLNRNSFSIGAQFCFLKINHWEYLSLGRERDQHSMKIVSRTSHSWVKDREGSSQALREGPLFSIPCFHCYPQLGLLGDTFFSSLDPSSSLLSDSTQVLQGTPFLLGLQER